MRELGVLDVRDARAAVLAHALGLAADDDGDVAQCRLAQRADLPLDERCRPDAQQRLGPVVHVPVQS